MSKYTAEQFEDEARDVENGCAGIGWERRAKMLRYAAQLAEQAEWPSEEDVERASEAVAEALGRAYDYNRVWNAWDYGTMGPGDFSMVAATPWRTHEIASAALQSVRPPVGVLSDKAVKETRDHILARNPMTGDYVKLRIAKPGESYE